MSASQSTSRTVATAEPAVALVASVVQDTGGHMPSIEAHPIVALEENMEQQREQQVLRKFSVYVLVCYFLSKFFTLIPTVRPHVYLSR